MSISREEINNIISKKWLEEAAKHKLEGCDLVRKHDNYIEGILRSDIIKFKNACVDHNKLEDRVTTLDDPKVGQVTTLWEERKAVKKAFWTLVLTVITGLAVSIITQNYHQNKTEEYLEKLVKELKTVSISEVARPSK